MWHQGVFGRIQRLERHQTAWNVLNERQLTLVHFDVRPDILPFVNHSTLASVQARLDREGNLNRVSVRNTKVVKFPSRDSIDSWR